MVTRLALLLALPAFLFSGMIRADEPMLPGSALTIEEAVAKSQAIFDGEVDTIGYVAPRTEGKAEPMGVSVIDVEAIRGLDTDSPWGALVSFDWYRDLGQVLPKNKSSYIFCVVMNEKEAPKIGPHKFMALKIVPAMAENIAMVKQLVAKLQKN